MREFIRKFMSLFAQGMINGMAMNVNGGDLTSTYIF